MAWGPAWPFLPGPHLQPRQRRPARLPRYQGLLSRPSEPAPLLHGDPECTLCNASLVAVSHACTGVLLGAAGNTQALSAGGFAHIGFEVRQGHVGHNVPDYEAHRAARERMRPPRRLNWVDSEHGEQNFGRIDNALALHYLFIVLSPRKLGRARCVTAMEMDERARRYYERHRR